VLITRHCALPKPGVVIPIDVVVAMAIVPILVARFVPIPRGVLPASSECGFMIGIPFSPNACALVPVVLCNCNNKMGKGGNAWKIVAGFGRFWAVGSEIKWVSVCARRWNDTHPTNLHTTPTLLQTWKIRTCACCCECYGGPKTTTC